MDFSILQPLLALRDAVPLDRVLRHATPPAAGIGAKPDAKTAAAPDPFIADIMKRAFAVRESAIKALSERGTTFPVNVADALRAAAAPVSVAASGRSPVAEGKTAPEDSRDPQAVPSTAQEKPAQPAPRIPQDVRNGPPASAERRPASPSPDLAASEPNILRTPPKPKK
jgi:hypothetical protein